MIDAIDKFGFYGIKLGFKRLGRCRPNGKYYGYDPVPMNIKGEAKWLI